MKQNDPKTEKRDKSQDPPKSDEPGRRKNTRKGAGDEKGAPGAE